MIKKAVLFDLDDTLYEYETPHKAGLKEAYKILKKYIKISLKKFTKMYNLSKAEIHRELSGTASSHNRVLYFQRLVEKTHQTVDPRITLELYNAYWNTFLKIIKLREGALDVLKELKKRKLKIALVSDLTTNIQLRKIHNLKITNYVDALVTSEEAGSEKPHSIMFLLILNKLDILPKEAIMVGDSLTKDIEGANAVGIDSVHLKSNNINKKISEDYRKPTYIIKKISEVLKILDKIEYQK